MGEVFLKKKGVGLFEKALMDAPPNRLLILFLLKAGVNLYSVVDEQGTDLISLARKNSEICKTEEDDEIVSMLEKGSIFQYWTQTNGHVAGLIILSLFILPAFFLLPAFFISWWRDVHRDSDSYVYEKGDIKKDFDNLFSSFDEDEKEKLKNDLLNKKYQEEDYAQFNCLFPNKIFFKGEGTSGYFKSVLMRSFISQKKMTLERALNLTEEENKNLDCLELYIFIDRGLLFLEKLLSLNENQRENSSNLFSDPVCQLYEKRKISFDEILELPKEKVMFIEVIYKLILSDVVNLKTVLALPEQEVTEIQRKNIESRLMFNLLKEKELSLENILAMEKSYSFDDIGLRDTDKIKKYVQSMKIFIDNKKMVLNEVFDNAKELCQSDIFDKDAETIKNYFHMIVELINKNIIELSELKTMLMFKWDRILNIKKVFDLLCEKKISLEEVSLLTDEQCRRLEKASKFILNNKMTLEKAKSLSFEQCRNLEVMHDFILQEKISLQKALELKSREREIFKSKEIIAVINYGSITLDDALALTPEARRNLQFISEFFGEEIDLGKIILNREMLNTIFNLTRDQRLTIRSIRGLIVNEVITLDEAVRLTLSEDNRQKIESKLREEIGNEKINIKNFSAEDLGEKIKEQKLNSIVEFAMNECGIVTNSILNYAFEKKIITENEKFILSEKFKLPPSLNLEKLPEEASPALTPDPSTPPVSSSKNILTDSDSEEDSEEKQKPRSP